MYEKFKSVIKDDTLYIALLLILVGVVSFGLGQQSASEKVSNQVPTAPAGVIFSEAPKNVQNNQQNKEIKSVGLVASKSGTRYHLLTCPGASQIKEENKIYFNSVESAQAAGYTPAANCKGL